MALKPPVSEKQSFEVSYQASDTSAGASLLIVGWVPKDGCAVPAAQEILVAPGVTESLAGAVPSVREARRMEIRLDLPDGMGAGILKLKVTGGIVAQDALTEDATWTSLVI